MMKVVFSNGSELQGLLAACSQVVEMLMFTTNENGVRLLGINPERTALIMVNLPPQFFQEYSVSQQESFEVGFNMWTHSKLVNRIKSNDPLDFSFDHEAKKFTMVLLGKVKRTLTFSATLLSDEDKPQEMKVKDFTALGNLDSELLVALMEMADDTGAKDISFSIDDKGMMVHVIGGFADGQAFLTHAEMQPTNGEGQSKFSRKFLEVLQKLAKYSSGKVELNIGNNYPIKVVCPIVTTDDKHQKRGSITYTVAPVAPDEGEKKPRAKKKDETTPTQPAPAKTEEPTAPTQEAPQPETPAPKPPEPETKPETLKCTWCGNETDKPYLRVKGTVPNEPEMIFCKQQCFAEYREASSVKKEPQESAQEGENKVADHE